MYIGGKFDDGSKNADDGVTGICERQQTRRGHVERRTRCVENKCNLWARPVQQQVNVRPTVAPAQPEQASKSEMFTLVATICTIFQ